MQASCLPSPDVPAAMQLRRSSCESLPRLTPSYSRQAPCGGASTPTSIAAMSNASSPKNHESPPDSTPTAGSRAVRRHLVGPLCGADVGAHASASMRRSISTGASRVVDIAGSLAHARHARGDAAIISTRRPAPRSSADSAQIARRDRARRVRVVTREHEDVHLNIERRLTDARSAMPASGCTRRARATTRSPPTSRLWLRGAIDALSAQLVALRRAFLDLAETHAATRSCPASRTCRSRSR